MFIPHTAGNTEYNTNKEEWIEYLNNWVNNLIETINPEPPVVLCFHPTDLKRVSSRSEKEISFSNVR